MNCCGPELPAASGLEGSARFVVIDVEGTVLGAERRLVLGRADACNARWANACNALWELQG